MPQTYEELIAEKIVDQAILLATEIIKQATANAQKANAISSVASEAILEEALRKAAETVSKEGETP